MKDIQEAVRIYLEAVSGVKTVCDRTCVQGVYPLLAVAIQENGTVLVAGGRQAEHSYQVTVTAVSDRDREGTTALLAALVVPLLRGVPAKKDGEKRILHPLNIRTEGEELVFSLEVCVPVPPLQDAPVGASGRMETLYLGI